MLHFTVCQRMRYRFLFLATINAGPSHKCNSSGIYASYICAFLWMKTKRKKICVDIQESGQTCLRRHLGRHFINFFKLVQLCLYATQTCDLGDYTYVFRGNEYNGRTHNSEKLEENILAPILSAIFDFFSIFSSSTRTRC